MLKDVGCYLLHLYTMGINLTKILALVTVDLIYHFHVELFKVLASYSNLSLQVVSSFSMFKVLISFQLSYVVVVVQNTLHLVLVLITFVYPNN